MEFLRAIEATLNSVWLKNNFYTGFTGIFGNAWQETKDLERMLVSVCGIEVDSYFFTELFM